MAKAEIEVKNRLVYRPCYVMLRDGSKKKGMFHEWVQNNGCVGLVEDTDGRMHLVQPQRIQFADDAGFDDYIWGDEVPDYDDSDGIVGEINTDDIVARINRLVDRGME